MATLKKGLKDILSAYDIDPQDKSKLWDCHGTLVLYHRAYEIIAATEGIKFDAPVMIEANGAERIVAMLVVGHWGERTEWSIGEAAPNNSKNSYPYAIAEKRAKDRVIAKLVGLAQYVYSEDEADEFKNPRGGPEPDTNALAAPPVTPATNGAAVGRGRTGGSIPSTGVKPQETTAQRILREIDEAKYPTTISTILAGNQSKFTRWSETPEGERVVQGINERANARLAELGA